MSPRTLVRSIVLITAMLFASTLGVTAAAQDKERVDAMIPDCDKLAKQDGAKPTDAQMSEARERYERGRQLYSDNAFDQAILEFERAYQLAPAYRILFNIAQVAMLLNDYPKAICAFEGYLSQGKVEPARLEQVKTELAKLRGRVAYVEIKVNVEGATVRLDDREIGTTPIPKPVMVNAGRHAISARIDGRIPAEKSITLAGQDRAVLELELKEPAAPDPNRVIVPVPVPGQPQPLPQPVKPEKESYVWVGWVTAGVFAAAAIGTGIGALLTTGDLDDLRNTPGVTPDELDDKQSTAFALGIATDALGAAAVVTGAITLYFQITEGDEEEVTAGVSPTGLTIRGTF